MRLHRNPKTWSPVLYCTRCPHQRTFADEAELVAALDREPWVDHETGTALCACHVPASQPTFPCDVVLGRTS